LDDAPSATGFGCLAAEAREGAARRKALPTPALPARAGRPRGIHGHVAELACEAVRAPVQATTGDDAPADTGAQGDDEDVVAPLSRPQLALAPRRARGVVVDLD